MPLKGGGGVAGASHGKNFQKMKLTLHFERTKGGGGGSGHPGTHTGHAPGRSMIELCLHVHTAKQDNASL